jgi:outer membrane protein assembly factor BamB
MKHIFLITILLAGIFSLSACTSSPDNTLPPAPLVKLAPTIQVNKLWSTHVGRGAGKYYLRLAPTVVGNTVFTVSYDGNITAVNASNGKIIWQVKTGRYLTSGAGASFGKLFVATGNGGIAALRQSDGKRLWVTQVSSAILATPISYNGIVLAKSIDGSLTALSQQDGRQLWRFTQEVPSLILQASSVPQFAGNLVVAGFANGKLAVINSQSGKPLWVKAMAEPKGTTAIERMVDIDVNPIVVRGVVYVATYQGKIAALDVNSGRLIWQRKVSSYAGIAADYQKIYLSDADSHVWAFDQNEGVPVWRQMKLTGRMITGPALLGNYVIVADSYGYLHWMSKSTGAFVARNDLNGSGVLTPPVVSGNTVYVYTKGGDLYAFRRNGGR